MDGVRMGRGGRVREKLSHGEGVSDKMTPGRGRGWGGGRGERVWMGRGGRREGVDGERTEEGREERGRKESHVYPYVSGVDICKCFIC